MHRVDGPGNVAGHWVAEDPENNEPGTEITADIMETLQEEICAVVESRGKVLNKANNNQLLESILEIASGADLIARYATTGNIVLNGDAVQAGGDWPAVLPNGTIVLVRAQTIPQDNGPYVVNATGAWSRLNTFDSSSEIIPGKTIKVTEGVTLADSIWMLVTDAPIVLNSTALVFERKDQALSKASSAEILAGTDDSKFVTPAGLLAGLLAAGGTSGNDYVILPFRDKVNGTRKNLLIQFFSSAAISGDTSITVVYPIAYTQVPQIVIPIPVVSSPAIDNFGSLISKNETQAVISRGWTGGAGTNETNIMIVLTLGFI